MADAMKKIKYLLIDDDPVFSLIMQRVAAMEGASLDAYPSFEALACGLAAQYDVAIIACDPEQVASASFATLLVELTDLPTVLVGYEESGSFKTLPDRVKQFVSKSKGYANLLNEAGKYVNLTEKN